MAQRMREMLRERRALLLRLEERRDQPGMDNAIRAVKAQMTRLEQRMKEAGYDLRMEGRGHPRGH